MRAARVLALIGCVFLPATVSAVQERGVAPDWVYHAANVLDSVSDYLANRIEVSGSSSQDSDQSGGHLALAGNGIIWAQHELDLRFRDAMSRQEGSVEQSLAVDYSMPLLGNQVELEMEDGQYRNVLHASGQQVDTHGGYHFFQVTATRPIGSFAGIEWHEVLRHSGRTESVYEDSRWVRDSSYQLSSFGLQCSNNRRLPGGFHASTRLVAEGGLEYQSTEEAVGLSADRSRYHRFELAASLRRQWVGWNLGLQGRYQFAPDTLPDAERIEVAGASILSGFNGQSVAAPEGGWARLSAASPVYPLPFASRFHSSLSLSVMRGWAPVDLVGDDAFASVSAGEVSLNIRSHDFHANMTVGRLIDSQRPDVAIPTTPDVSLSVSLGI